MTDDPSRSPGLLSWMWVKFVWDVQVDRSDGRARVPGGVPHEWPMLARERWLKRIGTRTVSLDRYSGRVAVHRHRGGPHQREHLQVNWLVATRRVGQRTCLPVVRTMRSTLVSAKNPEQLDRLVDLIHDDWFWTSDVSIVDDLSRVDIPLYAEADVRTPIHPKSHLVVMDVLSIELSDEARIGAVDINELSYSDGKVILDSGFPVQVEFRVTRLNISLHACNPS